MPKTLTLSFEMEHFILLDSDYSKFIFSLRLSGKIANSDYLTSITLQEFQLDFYDVAGIELAYTHQRTIEVV